MDITSLLNLTPAGKGHGTGKGNGTGTSATGETAARFADTLQAAKANGRHAEEPGTRTGQQPAAASVPGRVTVLASPFADNGLLQQLSQGQANLTLGSPLKPVGIADAEQMQGERSETELAESWLAEDGETAGLPAMALLTIAPAAMPSGDIAGTQTALAAQSGIASPLPAAVQEAVGKDADKVVADLEQPLAPAGLARSAQSIAGDSITAATGTTAASPLMLEAVQTTAAEPLPLMPATSSAATPTAGPSLPAAPALAMQSALGSAAWGDEFSQHLLNMVHRGEQQVDLYLHPRELGALSVSLSLDDQGARAQFFSVHGAVRSAVEQALPQLRDALAQQGISLGETSVGDEQQAAFQQLASGQHGDRNGGGNRTADQFDNGAFDSAESTADVASPAAPVSLRGIDLYA